MNFVNTIDLNNVVKLCIGAGQLGMKAAALALQKEAQKEVPVDTGYLRSTILMKDFGDGSFQVVVEAHYADYVEFGHMNAWTHRYVPPNPFFRRAIETVRANFPSIIASAGVTLATLPQGISAHADRPNGTYAGMNTTDWVFMGVHF